MVNKQLLHVPNVHTKYCKYFRGFLNSRLLSFARNSRKFMHREYYHIYSILTKIHLIYDAGVYKPKNKNRKDSPPPPLYKGTFSNTPSWPLWNLKSGPLGSNWGGGGVSSKPLNIPSHLLHVQACLKNHHWFVTLCPCMNVTYLCVVSLKTNTIFEFSLWRLPWWRDMRERVCGYTI